MRTICVVTGSRAEYGLLSRLMHLIKEDAELNLQVVVTNMHLSPEFGLTYRDIEKDGFFINRRVNMLLSGDTANATAKSVGLATIGFADAYEDLKPDIVLVLGDRFEILAAVTAALFYKIPVAHLHGGEITEGAYDDAIRHAITKMSHLHFTSAEEYRNRVIKMGEEPARVFNVGGIGIDNLKHLKLMNKAEFERSIGFRLGENSLLITFHPVTLERISSKEQIEILLEALSGLRNTNMIFTLPNSDTDGRIIIEMINRFVADNSERAIVIPSLGQLRYLSALQFVSCVVGNSSSGLLEVPSFRIPTLNIGNRQKGRIKAISVIDAEITVEDIKSKLVSALSPAFREVCKAVVNPYEKPDTAETIISVLKRIDVVDLAQKKFYNN